MFIVTYICLCFKPYVILQDTGQQIGLTKHKALYICYVQCIIQMVDDKCTLCSTTGYLSLIHHIRVQSSLKYKIRDLGGDADIPIKANT